MSAVQRRRVSRSRPPRLPAAALDPLLVGAVALVVYALHGYGGLLNRDLGVFTYGGEQVARGVPPYVGIFNSVGPLADALPGLAIRVGHEVGLDPVLAARRFYTLLSVGCCALLCTLARDTLRSRAAGFVAPAVFLTFEEFTRLASGGPREKTAMVLFLVAALVLVGRRRWFAAGMLTALATLTWQPVLAVAVTATAVALLGLRSGRVRGAWAYVVGGAVPTVAVAACYAALGRLGVAVDGFVVVNAEYTRQPSLIGTPAVWSRLWHGYQASLLVLVAGLLALLMLAATSAPRAVRGDPRALGVLSLGCAALVGAAWTTYAVNGAPDLFVLLPFGALGVAGAVVAATRALRPWLGRAIVAVATATAVGAALLVSVGTRSDGLDQQRAEVDAVLAAAPPGASVLSVGAPEVLALADRTNPTPYQLFDHPMDGYLGATSPGGLRAYAAVVRDLAPTLLVVATRSSHGWLRPVLLHDYRAAGSSPSWTWYVSCDAGRGAAVAVAAALAGAPGATGTGVSATALTPAAGESGCAPRRILLGSSGERPVAARGRGPARLPAHPG